MSITILGGINYRTGELFYIIDQKTNTNSVHKALKKIIPQVQSPNRECILILDKHTAHRSPTVKKYLAYKEVKYYYLPPNTSQINAIEYLWGAFKKRFRRK